MRGRLLLALAASLLIPAAALADPPPPVSPRNVASADELVQKGLSALSDGKDEEALHLLQRSLQLNPTKLTPLKSKAADLLVRKGAGLLAADKPRDALAWLAAASNLDRFDPTAPFFLAQAHFKIAVRERDRNRVDEARTCIREALRRDDSYGQAYLLWGYVSLSIKDYAGAVNGFRGALQRGSSVREARSGLAQSLWFLGVKTFKNKNAAPEAPIPIFKEAADLLSSLKDDVSYSEAERKNFRDLWLKSLVDLAETQRRSGNLAEAEKVLLHLVKVAPDDPLNWYNLGLFYNQSQKYDKALKACRKALAVEKDSHWIQPYLTMGSILSEQGHPKLAEKYLKAYVAAHPDGWGGHFQLGSHYDRIGLLDRAAREYERCIEIDPKALGAMRHLSHVLLRAEHPKEAAQWLSLYQAVQKPESETAQSGYPEGVGPGGSGSK